MVDVAAGGDVDASLRPMNPALGLGCLGENGPAQAGIEARSTRVISGIIVSGLRGAIGAFRG
jgi:hypothetical protein